MKNKRNMKKWIALGLVAALSVSITGCGMTKNNSGGAIAPRRQLRCLKD